MSNTSEEVLPLVAQGSESKGSSDGTVSWKTALVSLIMIFAIAGIFKAQTTTEFSKKPVSASNSDVPSEQTTYPILGDSKPDPVRVKIISERSPFLDKTRFCQTDSPTAYIQCCADVSKPVLGGADVVEYLTGNRAAPFTAWGYPDISSTYHSTTGSFLFYFTSQENKRTFDSDPERFLPLFGGFAADQLARYMVGKQLSTSWVGDSDGKDYLKPGANLMSWSIDPLKEVVYYVSGEYEIKTESLSHMLDLAQVGWNEVSQGNVILNTACFNPQATNAEVHVILQPINQYPVLSSSNPSLTANHINGEMVITIQEPEEVTETDEQTTGAFDDFMDNLIKSEASELVISTSPPLLGTTPPFMDDVDIVDEVEIPETEEENSKSAESKTLSDEVEQVDLEVQEPEVESEQVVSSQEAVESLPEVPSGDVTETTVEEPTVEPTLESESASTEVIESIDEISPEPAAVDADGDNSINAEMEVDSEEHQAEEINPIVETSEVDPEAVNEIEGSSTQQNDEIDSSNEKELANDEDVLIEEQTVAQLEEAEPETVGTERVDFGIVDENAATNDDASSKETTIETSAENKESLDSEVANEDVNETSPTVDVGELEIAEDQEPIQEPHDENQDEATVINTETFDEAEIVDATSFEPAELSDAQEEKQVIEATAENKETAEVAKDEGTVDLEELLLSSILGAHHPQSEGTSVEEVKEVDSLPEQPQVENIETETQDESVNAEEKSLEDQRTSSSDLAIEAIDDVKDSVNETTEAQDNSEAQANKEVPIIDQPAGEIEQNTFVDQPADEIEQTTSVDQPADDIEQDISLVEEAKEQPNEQPTVSDDAETAETEDVLADASVEKVAESETTEVTTSEMMNMPIAQTTFGIPIASGAAPEPTVTNEAQTDSPKQALSPLDIIMKARQQAGTATAPSSNEPKLPPALLKALPLSQLNGPKAPPTEIEEEEEEETHTIPEGVIPSMNLLVQSLTAPKTDGFEKPSVPSALAGLLPKSPVVLESRDEVESFSAPSHVQGKPIPASLLGKSSEANSIFPPGHAPASTVTSPSISTAFTQQAQPLQTAVSAPLPSVPSTINPPVHIVPPAHVVPPTLLNAIDFDEGNGEFTDAPVSEVSSAASEVSPMDPLAIIERAKLRVASMGKKKQMKKLN